MCSTNTTTAAGPCVLTLTRVSYYAKHAHSSPPTPLSSPSQSHPALHHYLPLYLPACLSRPLCPSHFHSYSALFCFHAGWLAGWGRGGGGTDEGMISLAQQDEEAASWRGSLSLSQTQTHVKPHCVIESFARLLLTHAHSSSKGV